MRIIIVEIIGFWKSNKQLKFQYGKSAHKILIMKASSDRLVGRILNSSAGGPGFNSPQMLIFLNVLTNM